VGNNLVILFLEEKMIRLLINKYATGTVYQLQEKIDGKWKDISVQIKKSDIEKICKNQGYVIDKIKIHSHVY